MVFIDWTVSGVGSAALDATVKYAGNSSCKLTIPQSTTGNCNFTHNTFSGSQVQVILWHKSSGYYGLRYGDVLVGLTSYGYLSVKYGEDENWLKYKVSFWYDANSNTKWGRVERWDGSTWIHVGGDVNLGIGSPSAGSLVLRSKLDLVYGAPVDRWFDEVEVYI